MICLFRISAANIGPNPFHQNRTVSWLMSIPRSANKSSTLRSDSIRFDQADFGAHLRLALRRALARTISFRMFAIKATLAGFPASTSWRYFALRSGLKPGRDKGGHVEGPGTAGAPASTRRGKASTPNQASAPSLEASHL